MPCKCKVYVYCNKQYGLLFKYSVLYQGIRPYVSNMGKAIIVLVVISVPILCAHCPFLNNTPNKFLSNKEIGYA